MNFQLPMMQQTQAAVVTIIFYLKTRSEDTGAKCKN